MVSSSSACPSTAASAPWSLTGFGPTPSPVMPAWETSPPPSRTPDTVTPLHGHRADDELIVAAIDPPKLLQHGQVHQDGRPGQPEVEQRHEALPARERLGLVAVLREERQRPLDRVGTRVEERRRLQWN